MQHDEPVTLLMIEFLSWIARRPRTYADVMEAWRSTCPRQSVWEDALAEGFLDLAHGVSLAASSVTLSARGSALLGA